MSRWDKSEDKNNVRYSILLQENKIKIVDLANGRMDWIDIDNLSLGGSGKAEDFKDGFLNKLGTLESEEKKLLSTLNETEEKLNEFYNKNFSWEEICKAEFGIGYLK
jgi:hypothetical protein